MIPKIQRKLSYEMYSSAPLDNAAARTDARTFIQGPGPGLRWQGPGQEQGLESQGQGPGLKFCP